MRLHSRFSASPPSLTIGLTSALALLWVSALHSGIGGTVFNPIDLPLFRLVLVAAHI